VAWVECATVGVSQFRVGMGVGGVVVVMVPVVAVSTRRRATRGTDPSLHVEAGSGGPSSKSFLPPWTKTQSAGHPLSRLSGGLKF
jgi:hypothetical protein